jgi:hypothetical protein
MVGSRRRGAMAGSPPGDGDPSPGRAYIPRHHRTSPRLRQGHGDAVHTAPSHRSLRSGDALGSRGGGACHTPAAAGLIGLKVTGATGSGVSHTSRWAGEKSARCQGWRKV